MSNIGSVNKEDMEDEQNMEQTDSLAYKIADLENYYADNFLSDELKELYAEVQHENAEFRNNLFFKNLDLIESTLGVFKFHKNKHANKSWAEREAVYEKMLRDIKTPDQLMKEFSDKAAKYSED